MDYIAEFYKRLTSGDRMDDIANELTDALNAAVKQYEKEQKSALQKEQDAQNVADAFNEFFNKYIPEETRKGKTEHISKDDILSILELLFKLQPLTASFSKKVVEPAKETAEDLDEIIHRFIDSL